MTTPDQPTTAAEFRDQAFITEVRQHARQIMDGITGLIGMQVQWNALDYLNTLDTGTGANEGIAPAEVGSVVFDTANAMKGLLDQGHSTNLSKLL